MEDGLYTWFIPNPADGRGETAPIAEAIHALLAATGYSNDVIVAPGNLSGCPEELFAKFDGLADKDIHPKDPNAKMASRKVRVSLLRDMNSDDALYRDKYEKELRSAEHLFESGYGFELYRARRNHSKVVILYSEKSGADPTFPSLRASGSSLIVDMDSFLGSITVNAVIVGSSNFNSRAYFNTPRGGNERAEADLAIIRALPSDYATDGKEQDQDSENPDYNEEERTGFSITLPGREGKGVIAISYSDGHAGPRSSQEVSVPIDSFSECLFGRCKKKRLIESEPYLNSLLRLMLCEYDQATDGSPAFSGAGSKG